MRHPRRWSLWVSVVAIGVGLSGRALADDAMLATTQTPTDFIIAASIGYVKHVENVDDIVVLTGDPNFSKLKSEGVLYIDDHGGKNSIGVTNRLSASQLVTMLTRGANPIPKKCTINLITCESSHFIQKVHDQLQGTEWKDVKLVGYKGCMIADIDHGSSLRIRVVLEGKEDEVGKIQDHVLAKDNLGKKIDDDFANCKKKDTLEKLTKCVYESDNVRTFYRKIIKKAGNKQLLFPVGEGVKRIP